MLTPQGVDMADPSPPQRVDMADPRPHTTLMGLGFIKLFARRSEDSIQILFQEL
jgi:hypothetical protein